MENVRQSNRIQTSFLNAAEKRILVRLAKLQPLWVTSDILTAVGFLGAVLTGLGYFLARYGVGWLWLSSAGLLINWYGDSLDGTLARVRHAQRPVYGYFLDHTMDIANELLMFIGVGLSPLVHLHVALMALVFYLILTVMQNINAHLREEFNLTYAKLGPTELRLFIILICLLFIFVKPVSEYRHTIHILGNVYTATIFDYVAVFVVVALAAICLGYFIKDLRYYAKIDPPKYKPE